MCIGIAAGVGKAMVVEFMRNGEHHKSVRWCSDPEMVDSVTQGEGLTALRARYAAVGADILKISKIETSEVDCG